MLPQPDLKTTICHCLLFSLSPWMLEESLLSPEKAENTSSPSPTAVMFESWKAVTQRCSLQQRLFSGPPGLPTSTPHQPMKPLCTQMRQRHPFLQVGHSVGGRQASPPAGVRLPVKQKGLQRTVDNAWKKEQDPAMPSSQQAAHRGGRGGGLGGRIRKENSRPVHLRTAPHCIPQGDENHSAFITG